jgi:hypothetical protein
MRAFFLLSLFVWCISISYAQVTITQSDMPASGDTLRYSVAELGTVTLPLDTGRSRVWNYAQLVPRAQGRTDYRSASSINPLYGFTFGLNSYGTKVADTIELGPIAVTSVYDFYRRSASTFSTVGRAVVFSGLPLPTNYSDVDEVYSLPLTYGRRDSTTFKVTFNVAGQGSLIQQGTRTNTVLGEGSITTPYGTYNALLVKVSVLEIDSIISSQLPFPIGFPNNSERYVWLAAGQRFPILEVTTGLLNTVTQVRYRDVYRQLVPVAPQPDFTALNRTLDEGDSVAFINLTSPGLGPTSFSWSLRPPTGWAFAFGTTASSRNPFIKFTRAGVYSVSLRSTVGTASSDTTKDDYITVNASTALPTAKASLLRAYPNPATNTAFLEGLTPDEAPHLVRVDAWGKSTPVAAYGQGSLVQIQTQTWAPGVYTLVLAPRNGDKARHLRLTIAR